MYLSISKNIVILIQRIASQNNELSCLSSSETYFWSVCVCALEFYSINFRMMDSTWKALISFPLKLRIWRCWVPTKVPKLWEFGILSRKMILSCIFLMLDTTQENFLFVFSGILRVLDVLGAKKKLEFLFFRNPKIFGCVGCQEKHLRVPFFSGILRILDVLAVLCVQKKYLRVLFFRTLRILDVLGVKKILEFLFFPEL